MKTKLTKIWGIGLVVGMLAMLIGAAIPVSAATLAWSPTATPGAIYGVLQEGTDVDALAIAPDGTTMFTFDNIADTLYKSTDAGVKWTTTNIGDVGLEAEGSDVVGLVVSPEYADDSTVVAATANGKVFRSINGGKSFGEVGTTSLHTVSGLDDADVSITSVDVSPHYLGGLSILVGTRSVETVTYIYGGVYRFTTSGLAWEDLTVGNVTGGDGTADIGAYDVLAVAFSPNHKTDAQYLAVVTDEALTRLTTRFGGDNWGLGVVDSTISAHAPTAAVMAFADDYEWSSNNRVLIGTANATDAKDDVYRIHGALPGGSSLNYDLNVGGSGSETDINSLAVKGAIAEADVLIGLVDSTTIKRCHDPTTSTVTWRGATKSPTGDTTSDPIVIWSPTTGDAYIATNDDGSAGGSAFSRSTDGGVTWNGLALMDVSDLTPAAAATVPALSIVDVAAVDANTTYIILDDSTASYKESLFKTTDGGSSWERVWYQAGMASLVPSPNYATDETLFVAQTDTRVWKTTNAGETFIGLTSPKAITAIGVVDKDTYYTGHIGEVYKSGRWVAATGVADTVKSIAIAADGTIFIGNGDGDVQQSTDDAGKFTTLGAGDQLGSGQTVIVVLDPDYASNNYIYAGSSDGAIGVNRWEYGTSTVWKELDDGDGTLADLVVTGLGLSADGSLYAASSTPYDASGTYVAGGLRRSVGPQGPSEAAWNFETMDADLAADTALLSLGVSAGSNILYAIADLDASDNTDAIGSYGYEHRLLAYEDILAVSPELSAPKDGTATPGTSVTFGWKGITSPVSLDYKVEVSTDDKFAVAAGTGTPVTVIKSGTGVTVIGFTPGTKYYWKVYASSPLSSKDSAVWTFTPKLTATGTTSYTTAPAPGAIDVSLRPVFQWASVPGATSYEMELADNPFFANASVKKPLTHTVWTWDTDLDYSTTYYWRARAVKSGKGILTNYSSWSEASFTTMAKPAPPAPPAAPPQITVQPAPPAPPPVVTIPPAAPSPVTPAIIWAIIIIGAVLVIAVIVLIVRTRRVP